MDSSARTQPGVFIFRPVDESGDSHRRIEEAGCRLVVGDGRPIEEQPSPGSDICALVGATHTGPPISAAQLRSWPDLRIVAKYTIGTDDVDVEAATELGILVTHCPTEANWGGVAEGTMALMLAVLKRIRERDRAVRDGGWRSPALEGTYLGARDDGYAGITIGIVGLGRIGRRLAMLLRPWRVRLLAADPYVDDSVFVGHGAQRVNLDDLLAQADVVTLHCNLTDATRGLIDESRVRAMKSGAVLINTARGAIVELDALCDGLATEKLSAVALDVFQEEPLPAGSRIEGFGDRVLLSPHMVAANRGGTLRAAIPWATDAVLDALRGIVPGHVYNEEAIPEWLERHGERPLI